MRWGSSGRPKWSFSLPRHAKGKSRRGWALRRGRGRRAASSGEAGARRGGGGKPRLLLPCAPPPFPLVQLLRPCWDRPRPTEGCPHSHGHMLRQVCVLAGVHQRVGADGLKEADVGQVALHGRWQGRRGGERADEGGEGGRRAAAAAAAAAGASPHWQRQWRPLVRNILTAAVLMTLVAPLLLASSGSSSGANTFMSRAAWGGCSTTAAQWLMSTGHNVPPNPAPEINNSGQIKAS